MGAMKTNHEHGSRRGPRWKSSSSRRSRRPYDVDGATPPVDGSPRGQRSPYRFGRRGGLPAREGIVLAQETISDRHRLDEIGIAGTRLNATVLQQVLLDIGCDVAPVVPQTVEAARELLEEHHIVVMGGTVPGHTTDTVAVKLAAKVHARHCIIATNVSHVFTKDPRHHDDAEALTEMTLEELGEIVGVGTPLEPGASAVVDPVAVEVAMSAGLDLAVLDGRELNRLDHALDGKLFDGTIIKA